MGRHLVEDIHDFLILLLHMAPLSTTFIPVGGGVYAAACMSNAASTGKPWRGEKREARRARVYQPTSVDLFIRAIESTELKAWHPKPEPAVLGKEEGRLVFEVTRVPVCHVFLAVLLVFTGSMQGPCPDGYFIDGPDTYILEMWMEVSVLLKLTRVCFHKSPRVILDEYQGERDDMYYAPDWVYRWTHDTTMTAIAPRAFVANTAFDYAFYRRQLEIVSGSLITSVSSY